ncbi:NUMOD4 domain-containing protein [Bacillus cereus]|uniref:NUMOD4 domain-containing protein n=1 Tax=Bacillus cereus TaxID=1396 RepID=UPI0011A942F9|nr:NUMOD4 domain-containing protein [Bacillus cereus]
MVLLYDPRTNVLSETTYEYLVELTGMPKGSLMSYRSTGRKIKSINCYIAKEGLKVQQRREWYEKEKYHNETWKTIKGSDDMFLISNYGRFKRIGKKKTWFLLPILKKKTGYLEIKVKYKGVYKNYIIAQLVAAHFIGVPKQGESVRYKNGIKTDTFVSNLEYISKEKLGKLTGFRSRSKPVVQLDMKTKEIIGEFRSAREAGRKSYLSYQAVLDNCNHKSRTSGGYIFMFADEYEQIAN